MKVRNASAGKNSITEYKVKQQAPLTRKMRELWRAAERILPVGTDHTEIYRYLEGLTRRKGK